MPVRVAVVMVCVVYRDSGMRKMQIGATVTIKIEKMIIYDVVGERYDHVVARCRVDWECGSIRKHAAC